MHPYGETCAISDAAERFVAVRSMMRSRPFWILLCVFERKFKIAIPRLIERDNSLFYGQKYAEVPKTVRHGTDPELLNQYIDIGNRLPGTSLL